MRSVVSEGCSGNAAGITRVRTERLGTAILLVVAVFAYAFWLTNGRLDLLPRGAPFELTFNSMLEHLLRGEFDVDPGVIGAEGFSRDGRVYAYWGIFFALLRWPLALIPGGLGRDVTLLSCLVAVALAACVKLQTLRLVVTSTAPSPTHRVLYWTVGFAILFSGPQIQFLRQSLYQEVCLWAGLLGAIFVYFAVRGVVAGHYTAPSLCAMAIVAGLALLARVSMGVALYAALGLLLLATLIRQMPGRAVPRALLPAAILLAFAGVAAFVNYQRWGDPLTFADYGLYMMNASYPDRLPRAEAYGLFNLARVPFGLVYYFFPIWVLTNRDGRLLFEAHQWRLLDTTELPPSSFLLTDPLLMLLLLHAAWSYLGGRRSAGLDRLQIGAIAVGLAAGPALMLTAISMHFRFRVEFYPFIEFGAFVGVLLLCRLPPMGAGARRVHTVAIASTALGVVGSHAVMILYKVSPFGSAIATLHQGFVAYYRPRVGAYLAAIAPWLVQITRDLPRRIFGP